MQERWLTLASLALAAGLGIGLSFWSGHRAMMLMPQGFSLMALTFVMWASMMLAMMLPGAAPAILTFQTVARKMNPSRFAVPMFVLGYGLIWVAFSLGTAALQIWLTRRGLVGDMDLRATTVTFGSGLLIAAGIWQLTPMKQACLLRCQQPLFYFAKNWKPGINGALRMGLAHGAYCVGCCWLLMALLFYGGVMSPLWITGLALYVLAEKLSPPRTSLSRASGVLLVLGGLALLLIR